MKSLVLLCAVATAAGTTLAQSLPPPSRTVYKCEEGQKIHYSDAPCLGAKKLEVVPTRGMNKSSGTELVGQDVRREQQRESFADAVRPLTGMDAKQLDRAGRRMKLDAQGQRECQRLDRLLPEAELAERQATQPAELKLAQERLFSLRVAFRKGRCE